MQWTSWFKVILQSGLWIWFFFIIQVNNICKPAYFTIWYRWVVNADNSCRMSDKGALVLYQEDDFVLRMQNNTCYSSPSQWSGQFQLPHFHARWDSTVTGTACPTLLLSKSSVCSILSLHLSLNGPSEWLFQALFACKANWNSSFWMFQYIWYIFLHVQNTSRYIQYCSSAMLT